MSKIKYNDPLIVRENESLSILLKHISRGSVVLEFGCANGRMTRYMSEELSCHVYIVEYEKEAFEEAIHYAEFGICDDIMNYTWLNTFEDISFDYIIFADVLEHLYAPQEVLSNTKKLLKDDGSVLISVPNICHNDIIAKLYMNSFVYTDVGLLDDTHIRFFSANTLDSFCQEAGYEIIDRDFVTLESGTTEQLRGCAEKVDPLLWSLLLSRKNGNVYQYILILKKENFLPKEDLIVDKGVLAQRFGKLYFNRGKGFVEEDKELVYAYRNEEDFIFEIDIPQIKGLRQFRYDPCENQGCIIEEIVVNDQDLIEVSFSESIVQKNARFLYGNDPQVIFTLRKEKYDELKIRVKFYTWSVKYLRYIEDALLVYFKRSLEIQEQYLKKEKTMYEQITRIQEQYSKKEKTMYEQITRIQEQQLEKEKKLYEEIKDKDVLVANLQSELSEILLSRSWRWTKLFRYLGNKIGKLLEG